MANPHQLKLITESARKREFAKSAQIWRDHDMTKDPDAFPAYLGPDERNANRDTCPVNVAPRDAHWIERGTTHKERTIFARGKNS